MSEEMRQLELEVREAEAELEEIARSGARLIEERDGLALAALRGDEEADSRCKAILTELGELEHRRTLATVVKRQAAALLAGIKAAAQRQADVQQANQQTATRAAEAALDARNNEVCKARHELLYGRAYFVAPGSADMLEIANRAEAEMAQMFGEDALRFRDRNLEAKRFGIEFDYQERRFVRAGETAAAQESEAFLPNGLPVETVERS